MRLSLLLSALVLLPATAVAVPHSMSHQGRLMDALGVPLDGQHDIAFSLYDAPAGGAEVFAETITTDFTDGYYSIVVNDGDAMDLDILDDDLWVELAIDAAPPFPDRLPVRAVPWAMRTELADQATQADHATTADSATSATTADTATNVSGGVVDASEIRINGTTVIDGVGGNLASLACSANQVPEYDGSAWGCTDNNAHDHNASQIVGGTLDIGLIPVGSGANDVAAGDHSHALSALTGEIAPSQLPSSMGSIVDGYVTDGDLNMTAGTTIGGAGIQTTIAAAAHAGAASAHHVRYSDSEAVSAVGPHLSESDVDGMVANNGYSTGSHLSEADVDGMVANNGYAAASSLSAVALSGDWNDLANKPLMVAWHAYNGAGSNFSGAYLAYNSTTVNVGNAYNTSNGVATIPAGGDGVYRLCTYTITPNGTASSVYMDLYINNSNVAAQGGRVYAWNRNTAGDHHNLGGCVLRSLSAGDTVRWYSQNLTVYPGGHYSYMNGERITF